MAPLGLGPLCADDCASVGCGLDLEVSSLIVWFFYTGVLHARAQRNWREKRVAWLSIVGFAMIFLSFLGNNVLGGLHAYGRVRTSK